MWRNIVSIELNFNDALNSITPFMIARMKQKKTHIQFQSNWNCWHWSSWRHNKFIDWRARSQAPKEKNPCFLQVWNFPHIAKLNDFLIERHLHTSNRSVFQNRYGKCLVRIEFRWPKCKKNTPPKVAKTFFFEDMIVVWNVFFFCFPLLRVVFFLLKMCS